tara:strand:+ start:254 stop:520 length:267 start_codon:yes stop_codon:yes gene_type:complete
METINEQNVVDVWRERPNRLSPLPLLKLTEGMPCRDGASMLGINTGTLQKWRNGETAIGLHYAQADRIAVRHLGIHPSSLWGRDWWRV